MCIIVGNIVPGGIRMKRYKYRLVYDGKWRFELLPNNNNNQFVARSGDYENKNAAIDAINKLKEYLDKEFETVLKNNNWEYCINQKYSVKIAFGMHDIFYSRTYSTRENAQKAITNILKHYHAPIRYELNTCERKGGVENE